MPPAARISDMHTCPMVNPGPVPHVGGPIITGYPSVTIGFMPAARVSDTAVCTGPPDVIAKGSMSVMIGFMPAARQGDMTVHGGIIVVGFPTVIIGDMGGGGVSLSVIASSVNPASSVINCGNIIDAVNARLTGTDPGAAAPAGRDGSFSDIETRFGTNLAWGGNFQDAFNAVQAGGPGTRAIVGIGYSGGGSHVVMMANQNGTVGIVEGQDWGAGNPREVITTPARANQRYNSDGGSNIGWGLVP